jgi:hypothetical protein
MFLSIHPTNLNRILSLLTGLLLVCVLGVAIPNKSFACHKLDEGGEPIPHGPNGSCDGGGNGGGNPEPLSVAVIEHDSFSPTSTLYHPGDNDPACLAEAQSLNVVFPRHDTCATLTTTFEHTIADDIKILVTRDKKSGQVVSAQVKGQPVIGLESLMHISDEMVTLPIDVNTEVDGSFIVHLHADAVNLWECDTHLLKHKSVCVIDKGMFAITDLYYFPDP